MNAFSKISVKEMLPVWGVALALAYLCFAVQKPYLIAILGFPVILFFIFFKTEQLWWAVFFLTPVSINLEEYLNGQLGLFIPTEIILVLFLFLSPLYLIKNPPSKKILYHPISLVIIALLFWGLITSVTSVQILVSLKSWISRAWYVIPIFYFGSRFLTNGPKKERVLLFYTLSFSIVIFYTFIRLYINGFPEKASQWLMQPFFKDHTILGAALGITIPYVGLKIFQRNRSVPIRICWILCGTLFALVLIFTYSRAAILSLVVAGGVWLLSRFKISFRSIIALASIACIVLFVNRETILQQLSQNKSESSEQVVENIESISNITTDASNVERINRWNSAIEMWKEHPLLGWGPGTYQFNYAPFQNSRDLTIISTNVGDVGNAHSEVLGALAESGLPGALLMVLFIVLVIYYGYRNIPFTSGSDRLVLLSALLGFVAYFAHGMLNNFLTSDKAAVPIWSFALIILLYDIHIKKTPKSPLDKEQYLLK